MTFLFAGRIVSGTIVATLLAAAPSSAQTPTLAEVAKREQERRKSTPPPTKVLTNSDLPKVVRPATAGPADSAKTDAPAEPPAPNPAQESREPVKDEVWWRARISESRERLHRDEVLLDALQARVNGLTSDFVGRDDPYQRARIGDDRQKAIVEMDRVRIEIGELKKKIDDIEEEARRAGVPPGWLR